MCGMVGCDLLGETEAAILLLTLLEVLFDPLDGISSPVKIVLVQTHPLTRRWTRVEETCLLIW